MIPWALESWANYKIDIYSDIKNAESFANKESAIVVLNHPGDLDWMVGWAVINRIGMLGVSQLSFLCVYRNIDLNKLFLVFKCLSPHNFNKLSIRLSAISMVFGVEKCHC